MRQMAFSTFTAVVLILAAVMPASGQTYSVLYNFGSRSGDPYQPTNVGAIAQGRDGNLYTTAPNGGVNRQGAVFQITPAGTATVLFSFDGTNGSLPSSGLSLGTDGNFYGTAMQGGTFRFGTLFKITAGGVATVLHHFGTGTSDGVYPWAPPVQGTDGNWYGTASEGGASGNGTVYKLTPSGTYMTLYQFDATHGAAPRAPLVEGTDGNLYGTTTSGGKGYGVVFKISKAGSLTVLYKFDNTHGASPVSALTQGLDGNFYGTAQAGGLGAGVVFKITSSGTFTLLHNMDHAVDGSAPYAGLVQGSDGNFYGTNGTLGPSNNGTVFRVTTNGMVSATHSFNGPTGSLPEVSPLQHTNGDFYGDTNQGGSGSVTPCSPENCGVFYQLNAGLPAFIRLLTYSGNVGSKIQILGQGFSNSSVVKFDGVQATSISLTGTTFIQAIVPPGASDGFVSVTTGTTTLKSLRVFIVHNSWGQGKTIPTPVAFATAAVLNGQIYVVGGYAGSTYSSPVADNQIYNPSTNTWRTGATMPAGLAQAAAAVVNNILYVFGGTPDGATDSAGVSAYNPATNTWSAKAPMPTARRSIAATVDNNIVYVIGGYSTSGGRLNTVEAYNPATNSWTTKAPMLLGKSEPSVGLVGSTIISTDGFNGTSEDGDNEGYNAATNTWSSLKADPNPRDAACGGALGGLLYVAGGFPNQGNHNTTVNDAFNPSTNSWITRAPLPHSTAVAAAAVDKGQLYCVGGWGASNGGAPPINNVQIYQP